MRTVNVSGAIPLFHLYVFVAWQGADYLFTTHLLTCSIQQSHSWKANRFSASQEITRILWNRKVHCRIHKSMSPVPILSKLPFIFSGETCDKHLQRVCLRFGRSFGKYCDNGQHVGCSFLARSQDCEKRRLASSCLSVCLSSWNNSAATWRIFIRFDTWIFFRKSVQKIEVSLKSDENKEPFIWRPI